MTHTKGLNVRENKKEFKKLIAEVKHVTVDSCRVAFQGEIKV